jgi:hypothetical protein
MRDYAPGHAAGLDKHKNLKSLIDAIKHATGSVGKVPGHQRRVGRKILGEACERLLSGAGRTKQSRQSNFQ